MTMRRGRVVRGTIPVAIAALVLPFAPVHAHAQPPTTAAGLLARYYDLSREAEKVNEDLLRIQEDVTKKRDASAAAAQRATEAKQSADLARSRAVTARDDMNKITSLLSGHQRGMSALVAGSSPEDVLSNVEASNLAGLVSGRAIEVGGSVIAAADQAAEQATAAEGVAKGAETEAAAGAGKVEQRKGELDRQINEVRTALDRLTPEQRSLLTSSEFGRGDIKIPTGNIGAVLRFLVGQLGKPYLWGAVGPMAYDCSGLVQTAFRTGGVGLPRVSIDQSGVGAQVLRHEIRAGDLIFFYSPVHHVAIAVDNLRAIHAPSFGQNVKVASIDAIGPITVIRRVMR